jgi:FecR protein
MHGQNQMKLSSIASLLVVAMLTIVTAVPAARAQNAVGTITQISGTANIQRAGATIAAAPNMPVLLHDKIVTQPNASLTIGLVDNSSLQLGPSSTLTIDQSVLVNGVGAPSSVGLLGGRLHSVIVGAMRGGSTTFQINTPNAVGAVRGTEWTEDFSSNPDQKYPDCFQFTNVDVQDGTVQVCNDEKQCKKRECRDVTAGHHLKVACCGFFELSTSALGVLGATALGVGLAGGVGVGAYAGAGGFSGGGGPPPPSTGSK